MFLEVASHFAVNGTFHAYEHRDEIKKLWSKVVYYLKNGRLSVLVIGPGGDGIALPEFLRRRRSHTSPDSCGLRRPHQIQNLREADDTLNHGARLLGHNTQTSGSEFSLPANSD